MCGIAAAFAYAGHAPAIARGELRSVRDRMAARGPDGFGEWFSGDGRVGLAHRRLAIIDLTERGTQPMPAADGSAVISFNGEIYNWQSLRRELQAAGRVFRSDCDTEVLLHLYELHGAAMLGKLRGMFAFALWDARRGEMLLARDPLGVKPLYYADDGRTLRAASQVKALVQAAVDTRADAAGHAGFLLWGSVPEPFTLYRGIRSLPAGHFMRVGASGAQPPEAFFSLRELASQALMEPARGSREDAVEAIAEAVRDSVRAHLVADVPVGLFLSAGLDSAMLASGMVAGGVRPRAITLAFAEHAGELQDEREGAAELARALSLPHQTSVLARSDFEQHLPDLLEAMDQPSIDGVNTWFVAREAARAGMKVALSGVGGDELFASYPSFRQVPRLASWLRWPALVPGLGTLSRRLATPVAGRIGSPKYAGLLEYGGSLAGAYLLRRGLFMPWELPALLGPDMAREGLEALAPIAQLKAASRLPVQGATARLQVTALESAFYMRNQLLRDTDWAGMAHSLEIRVPFADATLLERTLPWIAAHPSLAKSQLARAVAPALPAEWFTRPKTGFHVPVRDWLAGTGGRGRGVRPWAHMVRDRAMRDVPAPSVRPRVLVSTLEPRLGGVTSMAGVVVDTLAQHGLEPVIAHYAPYRRLPALSVPSYRLLQRRVGWQSARAYDGHEANAIGAWLPELEFTHYAATPRWRELIAGCSAHVAVSGNILAATPFWQCERPFLAWVATDWEGDRRDRVRAFHPLRKLLDRSFNGPVIRRLERRLLRAGHVLPLSDHTLAALSHIAHDASFGPITPSGVDTAFFTPDPARRVRGCIGFAGRYMDPRKNIGLLLEAIALLRDRGHDVTGLVVGDTPGEGLLTRARALGLAGAVTFLPPRTREELREALQSFDVFVIPSHQEGLCIAALEGMACGAPVVSTRCGGPEEFVLDARTGFLADAEPGRVADAIAALLGDPVLRERTGEGARELVEARYSVRRSMQDFWEAFAATFPHLASPAFQGKIAAHP